MAERDWVSLPHLINAAKQDPNDNDGHYPSGTITVEEALRAEGLLAERRVEGYFGTDTIDAYAAWQRHLGYRGKDADGIPGRKSLVALGKKHGFTVEN